MTANFLWGKALSLLVSLRVFRLASWEVSALRIALVFFWRRSKGIYFLPWKLCWSINNYQSKPLGDLSLKTKVFVSIIQLLSHKDSSILLNLNVGFFTIPCKTFSNFLSAFGAWQCTLWQWTCERHGSLRASMQLRRSLWPL